jgi:hypothetical protein
MQVTLVQAFLNCTEEALLGVVCSATGSELLTGMVFPQTQAAATCVRSYLLIHEIHNSDLQFSWLQRP